MLIPTQDSYHEITKNVGAINDTVNTKALSESFGTSIITIKRDFAAMQSVGVKKRVGSDKTGYWEVNK